MAAATVLIGSPPAHALTQPRITISQATPVVEKDFAPIPAQWLIGTAVTPTPSGCGNDDTATDTENPPPFGTQCDRIPLRIVVPTHLAQTDDYIVTIELSWDDAVGGLAGMSGTGNDMDLYVYDHRQVERRTDPESETYTSLTSAATTDNPESVKLGHPDFVDYNIVVINASGANTGYHLKVSMRIAKGDAIFELLEKPVTPNKPAEAPPLDLSAVPVFGDVVGAGLPSLGGLTPDLDLDTDFGPPSLAHELQPPPSSSFAQIKESKPKPVSGSTIAFWLVLVPLALVGGSVAFLLRRGTFGARGV